MRTIRIVVLECDRRQRQALAASLRQLGAEHVREAADCEEAVSGGGQEPVDLLLCSLGMDEDAGVALLRQIAASGQAPAVAIHGPVTDIGYVEETCRRLGLRYLGHLTCPIEEERLRRMVNRLRTFATRGNTP